MTARSASAVARRPGHYRIDDLVSFNGHTGKVIGHTKAGLVRVAFGMNRRRNLPESVLTVFVPWWSDRD